MDGGAFTLSCNSPPVIDYLVQVPTSRTRVL